MSKISLKGGVTGSATFTIESPATNTNRTLVLPDNAGTVLTSASDVAATQLTGNIAAARITDALNASGSAPIYAARAWVNFNGTGTVAIRASGNVSSITDNDVGDYTVNFTTAMPDANYSVLGMTNNLIEANTSANRCIGVRSTTLTNGQNSLATTNVRVYLMRSTGVAEDHDYVSITVFR